MTKLLKNKFLATILAVFTLFASVITVSKPIKANAAAPYPLIDDHIEFFVRESLANLIMESGAGPIYFIIDDQFFLQHENNYSVDTSTDIDDLNDTMFFQTMASVLADKIGMPQLDIPLVDGMIDTAEVFSQINMNLFIHVPNQTLYIDILNDTVVQAGNGMDLVSTDSSQVETVSPYFFGMMYKVQNVSPSRQFYAFLANTASMSGQNNYYYEFHTFEIVSNPRNVQFTVHEYT